MTTYNFFARALYIIISFNTHIRTTWRRCYVFLIYGWGNWGLEISINMIQANVTNTDAWVSAPEFLI